MDEELLECPICGRKFQTLSRHLKLTHKLSDEDISIRYPNIKLRTDSFMRMVKKNLDKGRETSWNDPEFRKRKSESAREVMKKLREDPEWIEKSRIANNESRKRFAIEHPEEYKERCHYIALQIWKSPTRRQKHSEWLKSKWSDPEYRKKQTDRFRNIVKSIWSDPEKVKQAGYGYHTHTTIEYNGLQFRSSWEVYFAKFLEEYNIEYEYESKSIKYKDSNNKSHSYIPDFYLPSYDLLVEIHPLELIDEYFKYKIEEVSKSHNLVLLTESELFSEYSNLYKLLESSTTIEKLQ